MQSRSDEENWFELLSVDASQQDKINAECQVPPQSPWFSGHFPGDPILPGVALLSLVNELLEHYNQIHNTNLIMSSLKRIKFKKPVRAGNSLHLDLNIVKKESGINIRFNIVESGNDVCSGIVIS